VQALIQTLRNLGPVRLSVIAGVGIALVALAIYALTRVGGSDMALLYGDLPMEDAGKVEGRLTQLNIPHTVKGDGSQIYVNADDVARTRLQLASEGLPTGGSIGYEIFDKSQGLATSSFVQNVNQLRALEGELSRTVMGIDGVKAARVHLVMPQRELFTREKQEPSASIMIRMGGPKRLDRPQVQAVQHLVAMAVPGLKPERISIVDERGTLLAKGVGEGQAGTVQREDAEQMRIGYEDRRAREIEALLERTLGYDKVRVEVSADMDFARVTQNEEVFNPDQQVVRSTQTVNDTSEQNESDGNPAVTIANNLPPGQASTTTGSVNSSKSARNEETINYEISRVVRNKVSEPGGLSRVSVGVLVDGTYTTNPDGTREYHERDKGELEKIDALVKSAVGFDAARGDVVKVVNLRFFNEDEAKAKAPGLFGLERSELIKVSEILVLGVIAILVLFLVVRPLLARLFEAMPTAATASGAAAALLGGPGVAGQAALPGALAREMGENGEMSAEQMVDDMIDLNRIEGRVKASSLRRIGEIVEKHPEDVVAIIRNWLYQET
jgi:flagellar M-ring protein FliF